MKSFLKDTLMLIAGGTLFATGLCVFAAPSKILTGGASGIAIILNSLFDIPLGIGILLVNIPLITVAFFVCGKRYTFKILYATIVFSTVIDVFEVLVSTRYNSNPLLCAIYGGILTGLGMYTVMSRSLVTGGSDLLALIIGRLNPKQSITMLILIIDGIIIALGAIVYKSLETALYSMTLIIIFTLVLDNFLRGRSRGNMYFIFSKKPDAIKDCISKLGRGFSVSEIYGGYTGEKSKMIICAVSNGQSALLRSAVFEADNQAFVIIAAADSVYGNGFITPKKEDIFK